MATLAAPDISVKPRVLIADDSRIVRASLIKHIEGMFEFREALNGEEAWETLLIDPNIRVVITDLTMPKLDGYGLLQRIRSSKISRIRDIPVVVVSGSDESVERERAKAAGATDLITKGIGTAQLLSRLDILSKLVATQREFERSLETLVRNAQVETVDLPTADVLRTQASVLLANAVKNRKNFVVLNVCVGLKCLSPGDAPAALPAGVVDAIGQLLQRNVRQTDLVARTGEAEFTLATGSINFDAARYFARRVCKAIASAQLALDARMSFIASCGVVSLSDDDVDAQHLTFDALAEIAHRRAMLGLNCAITGVVGRTEEDVLLRSKGLLAAAAGHSDPDQALAFVGMGSAGSPDVPVLLQWIREGRRAEVQSHLDKLPADLKAVVELALQQGDR